MESNHSSSFNDSYNNTTWESICGTNQDASMVIKSEGVYGAVMSTVETFQALLTLSANTLTILAVVKTPRLQTIPNSYVVSLAVSDVLSAFLMFYEFIFRFPEMSTYLNSNFLMCMSIFYLLFITIFESMVCITLITFERFMYICYPFQYEMLFSQKTVKISITISWILSIMIGMAPVISSSFQKYNGCVYGALSGDFYLYVIGFCFYFAMILSLVLHIHILRIAVYHHKRICNISVTHGAQSKSTVSHHIKLIKTFLLVYIVFYLCWFPWVTCSIVRQYVCISMNLMDIFAVFGMASGGINFIVYGLLNEDFRTSFRKLICGQCKAGNFDESSDISGNNLSKSLKKVKFETSLISETRFHTETNTPNPSMV